MRTERFLQNSFGVVIRQIVAVVLNFAVRTVFIYTLGMKYLGISGLFTNVLSVLSLAEMGLGTVIQYSMYKPMAEGDEEKLLALLDLYKKAYRIIALIIAAAGLLLIPFIPSLIEGDYPENEILVYYLLYLFNTVSSYFVVYKQSLLTADQKIYVNTIYQTVMQVIKSIMQMVLLLVFGNFLLYLLTEICATILKNILLVFKINRMYPFLKRKGTYRLDREEKKPIMKNVFAMFHHMAGCKVLTSTDNIIISSNLGLLVEGIYDNHVLVINAVTSFMEYIYTVLLSEVGNMVATEKEEKVYRSFSYIYFASFWLYSFCSLCFAVLMEPLMVLWVGEENAFGKQISILLAVQFFIYGIRKTPLVFKEVMGLMWQDRLKPFLEAGINLVVSLYLVRRIGVPGVILGTIISMVSTSLWVEPYVLYKDGFKRPLMAFWKNFLKYLAGFLPIALAVDFLCAQIPLAGLSALLVKGIVILISFNLLVCLLFFKNPEFKELMNLVRQLAGKVDLNRKKDMI